MADQDNRDELLDEANENEASGAENAAGFGPADSEEELNQENSASPSEDFEALREEQEEKRKKEEQQSDERAEARGGQHSDNSANTGATAAIGEATDATKENSDNVDTGPWAGLASADAPEEDETSGVSSPAAKTSNDADESAASDKARKKKQAHDDEEYFAQKKEYPHSFLYYLAKKYEVDQASFNNVTTKDAAPVKPVLEQLETVSAPEDPISKYNRLIRERPLVTAYPVGTKSIIEVYRNKIRSKNTTLETAMVNAALAKANPGTYGGRVKLLPEGSAEAKAMLVAAAEFMGLEVVGKKPDEKLIAKYRAQCTQTWQVMQTRPAANPAAEKSAASPVAEPKPADKQPETQENEKAEAKPTTENKPEKDTPAPVPVTSPKAAAEEAAQPEQKPAMPDETSADSSDISEPEADIAAPTEADQQTANEDIAAPPETVNEADAESDNEAETEARAEAANDEPETHIEPEAPRRSWLEKLARLPLVGRLFKGALEKEAKSVFRKLNELRGQPISEEDMNAKWKELPEENKQKIIDNLPYYRQDVAKLQGAADTRWQDLQSEDHQEQREAVEALAQATDQEPSSLWENMAAADRANIISNPGEAKKYAASLKEHKESLKWAETVPFDDEALDKEMVSRFLELTNGGDMEHLEKAWNGELPEGQKNLSAEDKLFYLDQAQLAQTVAVLEQVSRMEWEDMEGDNWKEQKAAIEALAKVKDEVDGAAYWNKMNAGERLGVIRNPQAAQQQAMMLGFLKAQQKDAAEAEAGNKDTSPDKENEKPRTDTAAPAKPEVKPAPAEQPEPTIAEASERINVLQTATPQPVLDTLKDRGVSDGAYRAAMEKVISEQKISREFVRDAVDTYLEANPDDETGKLLKRDRITAIREALIEHGIATVTNRQVMSVVASEHGEIPVTASQDTKPNEEARNILKQAGISEAFYQAAKTELLEFAADHPENMVPPYQVKGMLLETGNYPTTNNKHRNNNNRDVIRAADKFMRAMQAEGLVKPKTGMEKKRYPNFVLANRPD